MAWKQDDLVKARSAESHSFKKSFADLYESIQNPTTLAVRLYTADVLSRETRKRICGRALVDSDRVNELLDAMETMIQHDSNNFYKFVDELEKDSSMQHLCSKLRSTCGECDNLCLLTTSTLCTYSSTQGAHT